MGHSLWAIHKSFYLGAIHNFFYRASIFFFRAVLSAIAVKDPKIVNVTRKPESASAKMVLQDLNVNVVRLVSGI